MLQENNSRTLRIGKYQFETVSRKLCADSFAVVLPNLQAKVLEYFIDHKNEIIKRQEIVAAVWGQYDYFKGRSMDVSIAHLRRHLKRDPSLRIKNIFAVGFSLIDTEK